MKTHYKKPFYKTLIKTRKNVLTDPKIFGFKKKNGLIFSFLPKKKLNFLKGTDFTTSPSLHLLDLPVEETLSKNIFNSTCLSQK